MTKLNKLASLLPTLQTFKLVNFGCRVNAAETNLVGEYLTQTGLTANINSPDLIYINTCSITQKGEYESRARVKKLRTTFPHALIISSGCANLSEIDQHHLHLTNSEKEEWLDLLNSFYHPNLNDKFSHSGRFLLKVQSGCRHNCSYCIVPSRRPYSRFLSINQAVDSISQAVNAGFSEVIITGVNLVEYLPSLSALVEALLTKTNISLISFGSVPLLCLNDHLLSFYHLYPSRLSHFLHVPIQSGSDRILKLMNRPYSQYTILTTLKKYQSTINNISFGTDIIVGFPSESEEDFQSTFQLCQSINFQKIHVFRYSPRPGTKALELWKNSPVRPSDVNTRSQLLRSLTFQTKPPSHQTQNS